MQRHSWEGTGDDARLEALITAGASRDDLCKAFGEPNWNAIECRIRRQGLWKEFKKHESGTKFGIPQGATPGHIPPDFGVKPDKPIDMMGLIQRAEMRTEGHARKEDTDYKRVVIETGKPIAVMNAADLHFGGLDVDYKALREHVRFLFDTPSMYWQLVGDSLNLMIMHRVVGARRECMTPDEQIEFGRATLHESVEKGKLLAVTWGTHDDEFSERSAGFSVTRLLAGHDVPYFRGLGTLELVLGKQTYIIEMTHATRFNSFMNPVHGNKRMLQMHAEFFGREAPMPDVIVTAHTHSPAMFVEGCLPSDRIWFVKTGTFQTNNLYSQRWFGPGRIGVPTLVYHPDRHEVVGFCTPFEAYRYMTGRDWKAKK